MLDSLLDGRCVEVTGEQFTCARAECDNVFLMGPHNQKYCSNECCKIETNRKVKEKYHERMAIKRGKQRVCSCGTKLSRYNESNKCGPCQQKKREDNRNRTNQLVSSIAWL